MTQKPILIKNKAMHDRVSCCGTVSIFDRISHMMLLVVLVARTRSIYSSTAVYLYHVSVTSLLCAPVRYAIRKAHGPLLGGRCAEAHARRRHPASHVLRPFYAYDLLSNLSRTYDRVRSYLVPAYTCLCILLCRRLPVSCCVSYVAKTHSQPTSTHCQPRVASDSTKHTLEHESPVVVVWITL